MANSIIQGFRLAIVVSMAIWIPWWSVLFILSYRLKLTGDSAESLVFVALNIAIGAGAILAAAVLLIGLLRRASRTGAAQKLKIFLVSFAVYLSAFGFWSAAADRLAQSSLQSFMQSAMRNGQPLIDAIEAFASDQGKPPASLDDLVPKYLGVLPTTGIPGHEDYRYISGDNVEGFFHAKAVRGGRNSWAVAADLPVVRGPGGGTLIYLPLRNYGSILWSREAKPVADWLQEEEDPIVFLP